MRLQIQIILKNNNILECLNSLIPLKNKKIVLADLGLCDISSLKKLDVEIKKYEFKDNFSQIRNKMIEEAKEPWILWLDGSEQLIQGANEINEIVSTDLIESFNCKIIENSTIFKDVKLFNKKKNIKFKYPVFEVLNDSTKLTTKVFLQRSGVVPNGSEIKLLQSWKKNEPLAPEPIYYEAIMHLADGKYIEFVKSCNNYFFLDATSDSSILLRYYLAQVQTFKLKEYKKAVQNLLVCLERYLLFAEFWCLLGDIYWKLHSYHKAMAFYENATLLGSKRMDDEMPVEVNKYKEYPLKMAARCQELIETLISHEIKPE